MKKRLSVLLSIIIVLSICAPLQSVIASEIERKSVSLFSSRIAKLNENMNQTLIHLRSTIMIIHLTQQKIV